MIWLHSARISLGFCPPLSEHGSVRHVQSGEPALFPTLCIAAPVPAHPGTRARGSSTCCRSVQRRGGRLGSRIWSSPCQRRPPRLGWSEARPIARCRHGLSVRVDTELVWTAAGSGPLQKGWRDKCPRSSNMMPRLSMSAVRHPPS